ncbi:hypothetical protein GPECTOR_10g1054 [Gonium pectorale]|uniref:EF-hand domain-containing protein n=1 Tax=Gonium pectorale TaxID=33097 RepID=A0A150GQF4_GONPE|nr:hypothetical protein GPECTOR_10g1054 [Gonium pectorale]|eukprot:KXZ52031.1 hypothetical protein GPECTOR_10g1054 [Gonium pectorale]
MEVSHVELAEGASGERSTPKTTPQQRLGISINSASRRFTDKLGKFDTNQDGVIDAAEVAAVVDELVKEQALQRVYKFVAIGLFIVVIVLIGALTGITWAIVEMSKETKAWAA